MFLNWEEINKYYNDLNIKCYWCPEALSLYSLNIITTTFDMMHNLYPKVVINEIGDKYSYDRIGLENSMTSIEKLISNEEYFVKNFDSIEERTRVKKILGEEYNKLKLKLGTIAIEKNSDGNKYCKTLDYYGEYHYNNRTVLFNHQYTDDFGSIMLHEFGHALASQYNLYNNKEIEEIYDSLGKMDVSLYVSDYANENIREFIAECFMISFLYNKVYGDVVEKVRKIIDHVVKTEEPKSEEQLIMLELDLER